MLNIEQRTDEWKQQRRGKFTSSEIHKLMGIKGLGKTGETYAFEKAIEIVEGIDENELNTYDINRGIELEPYAFDQFNDVKKLDFISAETCGFIELNENEGSSPDGLVGLDSVLEIKCPRREKFYKIVAFGIDVVDDDYIYQVQHQMYVTDRKKSYFMNYIIELGVPKWHIIEINRDDSVIEKMKQRVSEAILLRDKYVELLKNNKQY